MRRLGVELVKNLYLMWVKEVTICNEKKVKKNNSSSKYILSENNAGKIHRDKACLSNLKKI